MSRLAIVTPAARVRKSVFAARSGSSRIKALSLGATGRQAAQAPFGSRIYQNLGEINHSHVLLLQTEVGSNRLGASQEGSSGSNCSGSNCSLVTHPALTQQRAHRFGAASNRTRIGVDRRHA